MSIREIKRERRMLLELVVVIVLIGLFVNILADTLYNMLPRIALWTVISILSILLLSFYILFRSRLFEFKIKETIPFVFAFNKKESFIPFFELWGSALFDASYYLQEIIKEKPELKEKLDLKTDFDIKFFLDLITFLVIKGLSRRYPFWWLYKEVKYSFRRVGRGIEKPSIKAKYQDLRGDFWRNIFSKTLEESNFQITLPPKTIIHVKEEKNGWITWIISLKNRYCEISLRIYPVTYNEFWVLPDVPVRFSSDERRKEFKTYDFFIDFEARFNRILSLSPRMNDYYEWAEGMLDWLRHNFDWRIHVQKIRKVLEALDLRFFKL